MADICTVMMRQQLNHTESSGADTNPNNYVAEKEREENEGIAF